MRRDDSAIARTCRQWRAAYPLARYGSGDYLQGRHLAT